MHRWRFFVLVIIFIALISLPYTYAWLKGGEAYQFGGFLLNPIDGNSYLAKMYQGWSGSWEFRLPYTAEQGQGAYLFLFYLFLGHASRWLGLPLIAIFHLARILSAVLLLAALRALFRRMFPWSPQTAWNALVLAAFGSGSGWLAFLAGKFTSDFWVAETYPFLAAYANPHFTLGLALMAIVFLSAWKEMTFKNAWLLITSEALLTLVMPFGGAVTIVVLVVKLAWDALVEDKPAWRHLPVLLLGGAPLLLYQYGVILRDPLLAGWNAQNVTQAPPVWDLFISLLPAAVLAIFSLVRFCRRGFPASQRLAVVWFLLGVALVYLPFNLQRRFMVGLFIPTAALAVASLSELPLFSGRFSGARLWPALFVFSVLTNGILLAAGVAGVSAHSPEIYLTRAEVDLLKWIETETPPDAVILTSPEFGKFVPAYTGRRVVYGHPFETLHAAEKEARTLAFYRGGWKTATVENFLKSNYVDYIVMGSRERSLTEVYLTFLDEYPVLYWNDGARVFLPWRSSE